MDVFESDTVDALPFEGVKGHLMIGGIWKEIREDELLAIMFDNSNQFEAQTISSHSKSPISIQNLTTSSTANGLMVGSPRSLLPCSKKQVTENLKVLVWLYSSFSTEFASMFLEFLLKAKISLDMVELPKDSQLGPSIHTMLDDWKLVITKLSNKEPELLLTLLKAVIDRIETQEATKYKTASGNKHLIDSAAFLAQLMGDRSLMEKLNKLSLNLSNTDFTEDEVPSIASLYVQKPSQKMASYKTSPIHQQLKLE
ncbi:hypothetical protein SO802_018956 [Lithocarpus litseifolius]|uniref:Uncharacterized protein n=1 Tax=Lithocarpus litseifolius TaxID=425828 RepID=A0AAW2CMU6_9ROSI